MFSLFSKLSSGRPEVRRVPFAPNRHEAFLGKPVWVKLRPEMPQEAPLLVQLQREELWELLWQDSLKKKLQQLMRQATGRASKIVYNYRNWSVVYSFCPWEYH